MTCLKVLLTFHLLRFWSIFLSNPIIEIHVLSLSKLFNSKVKEPRKSFQSLFFQSTALSGIRGVFIQIVFRSASDLQFDDLIL